MKHEPIEFGTLRVSAAARSRRRAARAARLAAASIDTTDKTAAVEAVDEAFAGFAMPAAHSFPQGLVADLSSQLQALDRQREQLSTLLRRIDAASVSR
jgi:hypothetical protein